MRRTKVYENFDEIEDEVRAQAPPVVYKYRSWTMPEHRRLLVDKIAWFAHPFTLNDKEDLRHQYNINTAFYSSPAFYDKLKTLGRRNHPAWSERELRHATDEKWLQIQRNPIGYFTRNLDAIHNDYDFYRPYGVFSTSKGGLNERIWKEYGDSGRGYCIGFKTVEFARQMRCGFGKVDYSDEAMEVNLIDGFTEEHAKQEEYLKKTQWSYEDEFRFLTLNIQQEERKKVFTAEAVGEIILGENVSQKVQEEIISIVRTDYDGTTPVFKIIKKYGQMVKIKV